MSFFRNACIFVNSIYKVLWCVSAVVYVAAKLIASALSQVLCEAPKHERELGSGNIGWQCVYLSSVHGYGCQSLLCCCLWKFSVRRSTEVVLHANGSVHVLPFVSQLLLYFTVAIYGPWSQQLSTHDAHNQSAVFKY